MRTKSGWWFQTWLSFSNIYGIILPIDSQFLKRWLKPPTRNLREQKGHVELPQDDQDGRCRALSQQGPRMKSDELNSSHTDQKLND